MNIHAYIYAHTRIFIRVYLYAYYVRFLVNVYLSGTVRKKESVVTRCTLPVLAGYVPLIMLLLLPYQSKLNPAVDATSCF